MKRFTLFLGLFVCLCVGKAWGEDISKKGTDMNNCSNNIYTMSNNDITVSFLGDDVSYNSSYQALDLGGTYKDADKYFYFSWTAKVGYTVKVTSISAKVRGYHSTAGIKKCYAWITGGASTEVTSASLTSNENTFTTVSSTKDAGFTSGQTSLTTHSIENYWGAARSFYLKSITVSYTLTPKTYTVSFNANDGTLGSSSVTATFDGAMPSASAPTRTGYTFDGYYDAVSGGKKYYNSDMSSANNWDKDAATTLYAHWTAKTYDVTLNDGLGNTSTVSATYGSAMPNTTKNGTNLSAPSKDGYLFIGYFDAESNGNQYYNSDMTSHQNWNKDQTTITLYAQYASKLVPSAYLEGFSTNNSDSVLTLTAGTTASFTFINTDNIEVAVQNSSVISYSNGTITAIGAGESTITLTQAETETTAGRIFTYHITVVRNTTTLTQNVFSTKTNQILTIEDLFSWNGNGTVTWEIYDTNSSNAEMIDNTIYTYAECTLKIKVSYTETPQYTGISDREISIVVTDIADMWTWENDITPSNTPQNFYLYSKKTKNFLKGGVGIITDYTQASIWTGGLEQNLFSVVDGKTYYVSMGTSNADVTTMSNSNSDNTTITFVLDDEFYNIKRVKDGLLTKYWLINTDGTTLSLNSNSWTSNYSDSQWYLISEDQYNAYYYYTLACEAIQTLVSTYSGEEVDALKVAMVSVLAENDYNSSNSYSERVTNLKEVIANCNSFVAAETHKYTLTVSAAGWSSLCLPFDATLPTDDGFVAYYARSTDGSSIMLTPITTGSVTAGEAIIVSAPAGDYVFIEADDEPSKIESNILQGVTESSTFESGSIYVLAGVDEDGPFFAPLVKEGNAEYAVLPANKAYLQFSTGNAAPQVYTSVVEDNTTTDLQGVSADVPTRKIYRNGQVLIIRGEEIYDMMGRRIQ